MRLILATLLVAVSLSATLRAQDQKAMRIELGRTLFFETRLSAKNTNGQRVISCATCHDVNQFGGSDDNPIAVGINGRIGKRRSPTVVNAALQEEQFWDERTENPAAQSTQPLTNPDEFGNQNIGQVLNRLNSIAGYRQMFADAGLPITEAGLQTAFATFEATLVALDVPATHFLRGEKTSLSLRAQQGLNLMLAAKCFECHDPTNAYRDGLAHNNGFALRTRGKVDRGEALIFGEGPNNENERAFKTPTLIGVALRKHFMQNGSLSTLTDVVAHYGAGGRFVEDDGSHVGDPLTDERVARMKFSGSQQSLIVQALTEGFTAKDWPKVYPPKNFPQ